MSELRPGLVLGTVHANGVGGSVAGLEYSEILAQLRNEGRPLTLGFDQQLAPDRWVGRMVRALYPWDESAGAGDRVPPRATRSARAWSAARLAGADACRSEGAASVHTLASICFPECFAYLLTGWLDSRVGCLLAASAG